MISVLSLLVLNEYTSGETYLTLAHNTLFFEYKSIYYVISDSQMTRLVISSLESVTEASLSNGRFLQYCSHDIPTVNGTEFDSKETRKLTSTSDWTHEKLNFSKIV